LFACNVPSWFTRFFFAFYGLPCMSSLCMSTGEEDVDAGELLRRFTREVARSGVMHEVRRRRRHEDARDKRKRKSRDAAWRLSRRCVPPSRFERSSDPVILLTPMSNFDLFHFALPTSLALTPLCSVRLPILGATNHMNAWFILLHHWLCTI
jgi:ribosomal protein S21